MLNFLGQRILQLIPTLFFVSVLIFSLQHLLPGDPALVMAGEERDPAVIQQIREQYKLDQPIPIQYAYWIKGVLSGDLGESLRIKVPVLKLIAQKLPVTMQVASMAIVIAFLIGIPAGIVSAVKKGTAWDYGANLFALWGISTPNFWLGIMLIFLFSVELGWLPASGYVPLTENWRASIASTIMPAFVLGNAIAAILMRHTRSAMLQVLESDYVRTARAKGLSERSVILKHAMRNALTPVITLGALELGTLLSGAVLTEQIFSIPGFGKLIVDAVFNRDYAVVQGVVLTTATIYITLNLHCRYRLCPRQSADEGVSHDRRHLGRIAIVPDELESPARRALRRLFKRKGAVVGLVVVATFALLALFAPLVVTLRSHRERAGRWCASRLRRCTGSAPTKSAATCCARVIYGARASLLAGVDLGRHRALRSACRSACCPAIAAASSTP